MNLKGRKATVFIIINIQLILLFILLIFFASDVLIALGATIIFALVGNGAAFIGGNVLHAWQKSKHYKPELDDMIRNSVTLDDDKEDTVK